MARRSVKNGSKLASNSSKKAAKPVDPWVRKMRWTAAAIVLTFAGLLLFIPKRSLNVEIDTSSSISREGAQPSTDSGAPNTLPSTSNTHLKATGQGGQSALNDSTIFPPDASESAYAFSFAPRHSGSPRNGFALSTWKNSIDQLRSLNPDSEEDLHQLYLRVKARIEADQAGALNAFNQLAPHLAKLPLEESFFVTSAMVRYSETPAKAVLQVFAVADTQTPSSHASQGHHEIHTPEFAQARISAYSVRELRRRIEREPHSLSVIERQSLVAKLTSIAQHEKSLDVALEIFQLLARLKENRAIETALASHSARDQKLIKEVIKL